MWTVFCVSLFHHFFIIIPNTRVTLVPKGLYVEAWGLYTGFSSVEIKVQVDDACKRPDY